MNTIGWIVRTETAGHHRYWKIGEVTSDRAAAIARETASADAAKAITRIPSHASPAFRISAGVVTEVLWESIPVLNTSRQSEDQAGTGQTGFGEITFDIVVPEEGLPHVEGCYRINRGNWQVYYLTNRHNGVSWTGAPIVRSKAVFQSGISGVSGVVPIDCTLNKKTVKKILAQAAGVNGWIEVSGPDSLLLK